MRKTFRQWIGIVSLAFLLGAGCHFVRYVAPDSPGGLFLASLNQMYDVAEPPRGAPERTFHARFRVIEAEGISGSIPGHEIELAVQPPDRLRLAAWIKGGKYQLGRDGQQLWMYAAEKKFGLIGKPGVARFRSEPDRKDTGRLGPLQLPVSRSKLAWLPRLMDIQREPDTEIGTNLCYVLVATPRPDAVKARRLPPGRLRLWIRHTDRLPQRLSYSNDRGMRVTVEAEQLEFQDPWPRERWNFSPGPEDRAETVAVSHLTEFLSARWSTMKSRDPPPGPPAGERRIVATEGKGRLERIDGTKVLFVKGSPEEMGRQHGVLLGKQIREGLRRVLYGMGVGNSLAKGTWFFGEMEAAQQRLLPHMDERYVREMDAMAAGAGISKAEMRMANLFPELFHCSGFALYGDATGGRRMYHGRVLDYFRGMGLEQNAVVIVCQPDYGNAWVNISYAGFVGSVTAMNEKHVAIGEMGGRGEGQWDGKPMAQLVREVMEQAGTIDEAIDILRRGPRTCEYYYVISDAKSHRAAAIYGTPAEFQVVWAGESHPLIPEPIKDAAVISGGDRFPELLRRIKAGYGTFDADSARDLMTRPVCMPSNIHSVLFAPDTLDFWVANADSENVASHARYTHYNLAELLNITPPLSRRSPAGPDGILLTGGNEENGETGRVRIER